MNAWEWRGASSVAPVVRRRQALRRGFARLRPLLNGLCATDLELLRGHLASSRPPLVPGHEIVARVTELAAPAQLKLDDVVVVDTIVGCGTCAWCQSGSTQLCAHAEEIGLTIDGGWQEELCVPLSNCYVLPAEADPYAAALTEPLTCELGLVRSFELTSSARVVVVGSGVAALIFVQLAKLEGADTVVAVANNSARGERLAALGADDVVLLPDHPAAGTFSHAVDAVGTQDSLRLAVDALAPGGRMALYGLAQRLPPFPLHQAVFKNLSISAHTSAPWLWRDAVRMVAAEHIELRSLITGEVAFDRLGSFVAEWVARSGLSGAEVKSVIRHTEKEEN